VVEDQTERWSHNQPRRRNENERPGEARDRGSDASNACQINGYDPAYGCTYQQNENELSRDQPKRERVTPVSAVKLRHGREKCSQQGKRDTWRDGEPAESVIMEQRPFDLNPQVRVIPPRAGVCSQVAKF
jgi:hypothetical protein